MQSSFDFTDEEIRSELRKLGYVNVPENRLTEFREDLRQLIAREQSSTSASADPTSSSMYSGRAASGLNDLSTSASNQGLSLLSHGDVHTNSLSANTSAHLTKPQAAVDKENVCANVAHGGKPGYTNYPQLLLPQEGRSSPTLKRHQGVFAKPEPLKQSKSCSLQGMQAGAHGARPLLSSKTRMVSSRKQPLKDVVGESHSSHQIKNPVRTDDSSTDQESDGLPSFIKRKVLRRREGKAEVCDESIATSADADSMSVLSDRLFRMPALNEAALSPRETDPAPFRSTNKSSDREHRRRYVEPQHDLRRTATYACVSSADACRSSVIIAPERMATRAMSSRCDPVRRHLEYQRAWAEQKSAAEQQQKGLRWRVRERMLVRDVVYQKRQRQYEPNTYEVPTSKQRKALRWQVRADMAHGVLPSTSRRA